MKLSLSIGWKALAIAPVVTVAVLAGAWEGANYYTSRDSFCGGSCHAMNEQYVAWQKSKHYAPRGEPGKHAIGPCFSCITHKPMYFRGYLDLALQHTALSF